MPADALQGAHQAVGRRIRDRPRAVPGRAFRTQLQPERPLLRGLHAEVLGAAGSVGEVLPALGHQELGVLQPVAPSLRADRAERPREVGLLVGGGEEEDVAVQADAVPLQPDEGQQLQDALRLHVLGPAPVDEPLLQQAGERGHRPAGGVGGDDVHVVREHQGPARAAALEHGQEVRPPGDELVHQHRDAVALEQRLVEQRRLQLVAGRVGGVDLEVLAEEAHRRVVP